MTAKDHARCLGDFEDSPIRSSVARQIGWVREQQHSHVAAEQFEMPRDHESVTAVVPFAGTDDDRAVDAECHQLLRSASASVLHQHEASHAELIDRAAINGADFIASETTVGHGTTPWGGAA